MPVLQLLVLLTHDVSKYAVCYQFTKYY